MIYLNITRSQSRNSTIKTNLSFKIQNLLKIKTKIIINVNAIVRKVLIKIKRAEREDHLKTLKMAILILNNKPK